MGAGSAPAAGGQVLHSVRASDRPPCGSRSHASCRMGFEISATRGTCHLAITEAGIACVVNKGQKGRPHIVDIIKNNEFVLIINTTEGKQAIIDSASRRAALQRKVSYSQPSQAPRRRCSWAA